jgi:hypothetical protein
MIKEKAGNPEASVSMHNLERIDASREWLGVVTGAVRVRFGTV